MEFFIYLPQKIPDKSKLHPWKLYRTVLHRPWKFQNQKPRPLKIPLNFFLVTPGKSTCSISLIPLEIPYAQPCLFGFFLEQPNVKRACIFFFHLILVGISSVLLLSVKNMLIGGWIFLLNRQNLLSVFVDSPFQVASWLNQCPAAS